MMDRRINVSEIEYLLDHLSTFYTGADLAEHLVRDEKSRDAPAAVFFIPVSEEPLIVNEVRSIGKIPVLFPCSPSRKWYSVEGEGIRFNHDILKSAFYLLSGYQEYENRERDMHGRYPWASSVQYRLGITGIPVVNYYFDIILEAFEKFCDLNGLEFRRKQQADPVLFLSHDVDRIVKYSLRDVAYWVLSVAGLKPSTASLAKRWRSLLQCARGTFFLKKDPYWNFRELLDLEASLGIRSSWYMLERTRQENSRYHFSSGKIRKLIRSIEERGHEIGIHGTLESSEDARAMRDGIQRLEAVSSHPVRGIRQHYLKYDNPHTPRIQEDCGLGYDSTLGFAEQTGFRNSYTHPFRLYDFERQRPFGIWQVPLLVMDVTLTGYMGIPVRDIPESIRPLLEEVKKFGGVLGMLWHNCQLDDEEYPGINDMYVRLLGDILDAGFVSRNGLDLLEGLRSSGA